MKKFSLLCLLILAISTAIAQPAQIKPVLPDTFRNVLTLAGMDFNVPKNAIPVSVVKNRQMHYEYAITFKDTPIEIRYAVAPMGYTLEEAYKGESGKRKENLGPMDDDNSAKIKAVTIAMNVGGGAVDPHMKSAMFPPQAAKTEFGADWGSRTFINLKNNSFGSDYKFCLMNTIHKNGKGSGYIFFLCNSLDDFNKMAQTGAVTAESFYALKFK
ncbi:hypothetical protein [Pedobacter deserti]|uniref:hypothetical protein n=1 Tax=Pedobacter deserti TaxID=2817382 RepID=UPI00210D00C2|nr:hypothetical protein [Pedobacter sp. SYSU D00382]